MLPYVSGLCIACVPCYLAAGRRWLGGSGRAALGGAHSDAHGSTHVTRGASGPASLIDRMGRVLCCVCDLRLSLRRLMLCPVAAPRLVRGRVRVRVRVRLRVRARARARVS